MIVVNLLAFISHLWRKVHELWKTVLRMEERCRLDGNMILDVLLRKNKLIVKKMSLDIGHKDLLERHSLFLFFLFFAMIHIC